MTRTSSLFALLLVGGAVLGSGCTTHAVWVWPGGSTQDNPVTNPTAQRTLIDNSRYSSVDVLYLSVYQPTLSSANRRMYEDRDIAALIQAAQDNHLEVWAAYGAPDWPGLGCDAGQWPLQRIAEVIGYNKDNPSARIAGVILDVEPEAPDKSEFQRLLALYQCVADALPGDMKFGAAIRFDWHTEVLFARATKPVYAHIIDLDPDRVVVMGYRDFAGTPDCAQGDGIICLIQDEIAYADKSKGKRRRRMLAGLETANCAPNCGPEKVTFFEEGQAQLNHQARIVLDHFRKHASFGGFAIHQYSDAYLQPAKWPAINVELPTQ